MNSSRSDSELNQQEVSSSYMLWLVSGMNMKERCQKARLAAQLTVTKSEGWTDLKTFRALWNKKENYFKTDFKFQTDPDLLTSHLVI